MAKTRIVTIDLNFQNKTQAIASYLIRYNDAAILIESGPGSSLPALEAALAKEHLSPRQRYPRPAHAHSSRPCRRGGLAFAAGRGNLRPPQWRAAFVEP